MGEAKRKRDRYRKAIENNERWILFPREIDGDACSGSFEYLSDLIADRFAKLEVEKTVYKDFDNDQFMEVIGNPEQYSEIINEANRIESETFNRLKNSIRDHCAKYGKYEFNFLVDDEDQVIDREELTYRPELDPPKKLP